ncbi:MAG TPA: hypothetical protein VKB50_01835 [Vicinamibacterales bacterium]|nr:hypothetical protein [Vicinamibacterales bacterium]
MSRLLVCAYGVISYAGFFVTSLDAAGFARPWFTRALLTLIPQAAERSTSVLASIETTRARA